VSTGDYVPYIVYDSYGEPAFEWEQQADELVARYAEEVTMPLLHQAEQATLDGPGPDFEPRPIPEPWLEPETEAEAGQ
jgi:hypothetical protein